VALVALFAWLGFTVNDTFDELASLGRGVQEAGNSVQGGFEDAGGLLGDVPIVGDDLNSESGAVRSTFGAGLGGFGFKTEATVRTSALAVPASTVILSPTRKPLRLAALIPVAPTAEATVSSVSTKRSAPVSKL
jgi:hypothetical protein